MKTRNKLLTLLILSAGAATTTALINKAIKLSATSRNVLGEPEALCYKWRLGNIYYTRTGSGKPLLLVHDLTPASSGYEWKNLVGKLAENHTVYTIDLLGFGRSEKPNLTYTNYLYVQLLCDFIKSEIGHRTDMLSSGSSSTLGIMACSNSPELFDQLMFINPESILSSSQLPGKNVKLYKFMLDLPIVGTLIYHISCSKQALTKEFMTNYYYNPYSVRAGMIDAYHEAAHLGESPKSVYASLECNYVKCNIVNALKKIDNSIYLIGGAALDEMEELMSEYKDYNPAVETASIPNTKLTPHLEKPSEVYQLIQTFLS
ncbi:alpha/beta fold hydrolase [Clostridium sp. FS41]|uniref:alpha/beta fold hydrolase n=1 Tax=Clostridium sp. FS41 TaxID=1609975 RepID=UPI0005D333C7|nr:alpha/beta fold hydrolase [Clostridium sp. FS41]KJJ77252.1 2-hydroxy-6-oxo-6-(2'-aminophenyl)hexa-2,4-dienoic acid hydrolase [Clostridium sp. FS41]